MLTVGFDDEENDGHGRNAWDAVMNDNVRYIIIITEEPLILIID